MNATSGTSAEAAYDLWFHRPEVMIQFDTVNRSSCNWTATNIQFGGSGGVPVQDWTPRAPSTWSPITSPVTTARASGPGWSAIPASATPSSPRAPAGSTCRRPGGGSSGARRWPGRTSPTRRDRPRHPGGHRPAQRPRPAPGTTSAQTPLLPPTLYIHPLRNIAPAVVC
jgi:hypothetical protein